MKETSEAQRSQLKGSPNCPNQGQYEQQNK